MKKNHCVICDCSEPELNLLKLYNATDSYACDCVKYICDSCFKNPEVMAIFYTDCAKTCDKKIPCSVANLEKISTKFVVKEFYKLKKSHDLKEKCGFLIYVIPLFFALGSMFLINDYLSRELVASLVYLIVFSICYFAYKRL